MATSKPPLSLEHRVTQLEILMAENTAITKSTAEAIAEIRVSTQDLVEFSKDAKGTLGMADRALRFIIKPLSWMSGAVVAGYIGFVSVKAFLLTLATSSK